MNEETKQQLAGFGKKGESFDEVLRRIMANATKLCSSKEMEEDDVDEDEE